MVHVVNDVADHIKELVFVHLPVSGVLFESVIESFVILLVPVLLEVSIKMLFKSPKQFN